MKYQTQFFEDIQPLLKMSYEEASNKGIMISNIEVSQKFFDTFSAYLEKHDLYTYFRYGDGGRDNKGSIYTYTCNFRLAIFRKSYQPRFYIGGHGSEKNVNASKLEHCRKETPTLLQLFYDMVAEYRNDIIKIEWFISPRFSI